MSQPDFVRLEKRRIISAIGRTCSWRYPRIPAQKTEHLVVPPSADFPGSFPIGGSSHRVSRRCGTYSSPISVTTWRLAPASVSCATVSRWSICGADSEISALPQPWQRDTLVNVYSTTKGIAALAFATLVEDGLLDFDDPVRDYWPELRAASERGLRSPQLLSHQGGSVWRRSTLERPRSFRLGEDVPSARAADTVVAVRERTPVTTR